MHALKDFSPGIYEVIRPDQPRAPLLFNSPHSGSAYPDDFGYACDPHLLHRAEDTLVDELFMAAPRYGLPLLKALFPRTYIDANRGTDDIDEDLIEGVWPATVTKSGRSAAGHGLIRRNLRPGIPVYNRTLSITEVQSRLDRYYHPYHSVLASLLDEIYAAYGQVWLIDCHSMPSSSAYTSSGGVFRSLTGAQVDIVLGTRDGTTCSTDFAQDLKNYLKQKGYRVAINNPYKGMEILKRHGDPLRGKHALQIEISKALYLNEDQNTRSKNFVQLQHDMTGLIGFVRDYVAALQMPQAAD